jgi:hypothetical protein
VASPIDSVDVVAAKTRVPPFATVNDLQTTEIDAGIVTVTPLGIVISSAAAVATPLKAVDEAAVECQFPVTAVRFAISNPSDDAGVHIHDYTPYSKIFLLLFYDPSCILKSSSKTYHIKLICSRVIDSGDEIPQVTSD